MKEFAFDVTLYAFIRVPANSEDEARAVLNEALDCANANLGAWPNGDPILCEASLKTSGEVQDPVLIEVDGEAVS